MKLTVFLGAILVITVGLIANSPDSPQAASDNQLKQAFGTQKWTPTVQAVNQINKRSTPKPNSKLMLYRALLSHR